MPAAKKSSQAKSSTTKSTSSAAGDAIALLKADHEEVKQKFDDYQALVDAGADGDARGDLAEIICAMLTAHTTIEEEIFYPAARTAIEEAELLDEAEVEHASAKDLIAQLQDMDPDEPLYDAKLKVLGEYVLHHVQEEEGEMFPAVKKTKLDLQSLGKKMAVRKGEILTELGVEAVN